MAEDKRTAKESSGEEREGWPVPESWREIRRTPQSTGASDGNENAGVMLTSQWSVLKKEKARRSRI